ncbi:MAG: hypothetical protein EP343_22550 [Deltaproteobacteria bacterium]|nr:MAG: hypothetical protein EP343_22550 [Deltaproteobacteria bacterium]
MRRFCLAQIELHLSNAIVESSSLSGSRNEKTLDVDVLRFAFPKRENRMQRAHCWLQITVVVCLVVLGGHSPSHAGSYQERQFWNLVERGQCYRAHYWFRSRIQKNAVESKKKQMLRSLLSCWWKKNNNRTSTYESRDAQAFLKLENKTYAALRARLRLARYYDQSLSVYYHYPNNYRQKGLFQQMKQLRILMGGFKAQLTTQDKAAWYRLEMRQATREKKYALVYEYVQMLCQPKFSPKVRHQAYSFWLTYLLARYQVGGAPKDYNSRRTWLFRKAQRALRGTTYEAQWEYNLLSGRLQQAKTKNRWPSRQTLARLKRLSQGKSGWARSARALYLQWTEPGLSVNTTTLWRPKQSHPVHLTLLRIQRATVRLYRANVQPSFLQDKKLFAPKRIRRGKLVWSRNLSMKKIPLSYWANSTAIQRTLSIPKLGSGSYVLEVKGFNRFKKTITMSMPILVSPYAIVVKLIGHKAILQVVDGRNHRPIRKAKVWLGVVQRQRTGRPTYGAWGYRRYRGYRYRRSYRRRYYPYRYRYQWNHKYNVSARRTGVTDASGMLTFQLPKKTQPRELCLMACIKSACTTYHRYRSFQRLGLHENVFWTSDRGAYRPGQTYKFKGFLVVRHGSVKDRTQKRRKLDVQVKGSKNKVVFRKTFVTNDFGSFHGAFELPKSGTLGRYQVWIKVYYGPTSRRYRSFLRYFRVEEYRRQKVQVSASLMPGRFLAGDTLRWKVQARYTFGGAVRGGKVRWRLGSMNVYPRFSMPQPYAWLLGFTPPSNGLRTYEQWEQQQKYSKRNLTYQIRSYRRSLRYYRQRCKRYKRRYKRYRGSRRYLRYRRYNPCRYIKNYVNQIKRWKEQMGQATWKEGVLNDKGELVVTTPTSKGWRYQQYFLAVEVTDSSGQTSLGQGSTVLGKNEAFAFLQLKRQIVQPGGNVVVDLRTLRPNGKGTSLPGVVTVQRIRWRRNRQVLGKVVRRFRVRTKANGRATLRFSMDALGLFRVTYKVKGKNKAVVAKSTNLWLAGPRLRRLSMRTSHLEVVTDRKVYRPGESITLLVRQKKRPHSYWVSVENQGLQWSQVVRAKGRITFLKIPVKTSFAPNAWVSVSHFQDYVWHHRMIRVAVPPSHRFLKVQISKLKSSYKPGEKVRWTLRAVDGNNKPVRSEFLLLAYDQSLDVIGGLNWPNLKRTFVPPVQRSLVSTSGGRWVRNKLLHEGARISSRITYKQLMQQLAYQRSYRQKLQRSRRTRSKAKDAIVGSGRGYGKTSNSFAGRGSVQPSPKSNRPSAVPPSAADQPSISRMAKASPRRRSLPSPDNEDDTAKPRATGTAQRGVGNTYGSKLPSPRLRTDFRETAVWLAQVKTDRKGRARVSFRWPDSLTTWSIRAVAVGTNAEVGSLQTVTQTQQPLMVRLATPRFVMQGDKAEVTVMVYNRGKSRRVKVSLQAKGAALLDAKPIRGRLRKGSNGRWNFWVKPSKTGTLQLTAKVQSSDAADAVQVKLPVHAFGMPQQLHWAGAMQKGETKEIAVQIPKEVVEGSQQMELVLTSSLSRSVFEGLGYLVQFPYGCVEQTMSRFLPAVLVAKTFANFDKVKPKLARKLPKVLRAGLGRLYAFQHSDGGWGWWKHDRTNRFMTSYVLFGLASAKQAGVRVRARVMSRAAIYLQGQLRTMRNQPSLHAYALYALALAGKLPLSEADYSLRYLKKLNPYGHALLALAFEAKGDKKTARYILKQLKGYIQNDGTGRASFRGKGTLRGWSQDGLEATAVALRAFVKAKFGRSLWAPMARWLLGQRRGARWRSTRDSAQALLSLGAFSIAMGEQNKGKRGVEVLLDGRVLTRRTFSNINPMGGGARIVLGSKVLQAASQTLKLRNIGKGSLFYSAALRFVTKATRIRKGGHPDLQVTRKYFRVVNQKGREVLQPISWGAVVKAGSEIEVQVTLRSNRRLRYLLVEDKKPAGLEPVQIRSGRPAESWISHFELRDTHAAFFVGWLPPRVSRTLRYRLRAERAGSYRTLPARSQAMYAPKVDSHSESFLFVVR